MDKSVSKPPPCLAVRTQGGERQGVLRANPLGSPGSRLATTASRPWMPNKPFTLLLLGLSVIALANIARADDLELPQNARPFTTTTPFAAQDEKKVLVYFKYDCPYCREYHAMLTGWGQTLPAGYSLEFVPVIESGDNGQPLKKNIVPFMLYETMERIPGVGPANLQSFSERAYAIEQDGPMKPNGNDAEWKAAVHRAGVSGPQMENAAAWASQWMPDAINRQVHYQLKETPTLVICGKYEVSPGITNGDHAMFQQLINGVMSKCMIDQGLKPTGG